MLGFFSQPFVHNYAELLACFLGVLHLWVFLGEAAVHSAASSSEHQEPPPGLSRPWQLWIWLLLGAGKWMPWKKAILQCRLQHAPCSGHLAGAEQLDQGADNSLRGCTLPLVSPKEQNSFTRSLGSWILAAAELGCFLQNEKFPAGRMRNFVSSGRQRLALANTCGPQDQVRKVQGLEQEQGKRWICCWLLHRLLGDLGRVPSPPSVPVCKRMRVCGFCKMLQEQK